MLINSNLHQIHVRSGLNSSWGLLNFVEIACLGLSVFTLQVLSLALTGSDGSLTATIAIILHIGQDLEKSYLDSFVLLNTSLDLGLAV